MNESNVVQNFAQILPISYEDMRTFVGKYYAQIYPESAASQDTPFWQREDANKLAYYHAQGDCYGFFDGKQLIGVFMGTPYDWSTYYLRSAGILPQYQGRGIWQAFLGKLFQDLAAKKIERIIGDVHPSNHREIHVFNKLGFVITGFKHSDRWGNIIEFTKFIACFNLDQARQSPTRNKFVAGDGLQSHSKPI